MNSCSNTRPCHGSAGRRSFGRAALALVLGVLVGQLGVAGPARAEAPWTIVTTTAQVGDLVRGVAGDRATVISLMGAGVDPHLYRAARSDIVRMSRADMVFVNGLHLEGRMGEMLDDLAGQKPVVAVAEGLPETILLDGGYGGGRFDPHVWMDVNAWIAAAARVRDALIAFDPAGTEAYRVNGETYIAQLAALDSYARQVLGSVPEASRVLVTAHDAFNYFGRAYGFEVIGIQGISTESEAGLRRIEEIVDLLVSRRIGAVFVETSVSDRNVRALIDGARARGHEVRIGGSLYSDAMGEPGTYEGTYIGMIDHNVTVIARALGGTAPAGGMSGQLVALNP